MRVLFAIHGPADPKTAVFRTVDTKAKFLRRAGHEADVVSADDLRWTSSRFDPFFLPPALAARRLRTYDAVVFHSYLGWAFHAARPLVDPVGRTVTVTSFHGLEPLYFQALVDDAARRGVELSARYRWLYGTVMPKVLRQTCRRSDAVFCLNSTEADYIVSHEWAQTDRVHVLPNGVEAESFVERPSRPRLSQLLFIGQWLSAKGTAELVEAFTALARSTDVRLTCAGTGASADAVRAAFPADVRDRVDVRPTLDRAGIHDALRAADLFVFPSLSEGFSKALLEAMAAGLPIVATPVGAAIDILADGHNARVVPPATAGAVTDAVRAYLDDPDLARRHGEAARETAERYRLDSVCQEWLDRLVEVVERRASERLGASSEKLDAAR